MALAVVAIIGRPNVGKSSLLNALAGEMISIVEPTPGVTRDRVSAVIERDNVYFEMVDTGGYGITDSADLAAHIDQQIHRAIESAELVLFVVDVRDGLMPIDEQIAGLLRKKNLNVILVANKADTPRFFPQAAEFTKLGFGEPLCVSALNNLNKNLLLEQIVSRIHSTGAISEKPTEAIIKIAIVGKRNVGKSSLLNTIVGQQRVIVSETPGTTRDAVDVRFEEGGKTYIAIDTPGLRKKRKIVSDNIEFYGFTRTRRAITRADVALLLIDAAQPVSTVDKQLADFITSHFKPCILVVNKWDLIKGYAGQKDYRDYLSRVLPHLRHAPAVFTTATKGKNVQRLLNSAMALFKQNSQHIPTAKLNKAIELIKAERPTAIRAVRTPKIFYATQVETNPITLLFFVNRLELFDENYKRFVVNRLREHLNLPQVPLRLLLRPRRD